MTNSPEAPDWSNAERVALRTPTLPFDPEKTRELFEQWGFSGHVGLNYHAHGPDWCELFVEWRAELTVDKHLLKLRALHVSGQAGHAV